MEFVRLLTFKSQLSSITLSSEGQSDSVLILVNIRCEMGEVYLAAVVSLSRQSPGDIAGSF